MLTASAHAAPAIAPTAIAPSGETDEQFLYKTRKKAIGPFKRQLWELPSEVKERLARAYDQKFEFLFTQLGVAGTRKYVEQYVTSVATGHTSGVAAAPDDADLSD